MMNYLLRQIVNEPITWKHVSACRHKDVGEDDLLRFTVSIRIEEEVWCLQSECGRWWSASRPAVDLLETFSRVLWLTDLKKNPKYSVFFGYCIEKNRERKIEVKGQTSWGPQKGNRNSKRNCLACNQLCRTESLYTPVGQNNSTRYFVRSSELARCPEQSCQFLTIALAPSLLNIWLSFQQWMKSHRNMHRFCHQHQFNGPFITSRRSSLFLCGALHH